MPPTVLNSTGKPNTDSGPARPLLGTYLPGSQSPSWPSAKAQDPSRRAPALPVLWPRWHTTCTFGPLTFAVSSLQVPHHCQAVRGLSRAPRSFPISAPGMPSATPQAPHLIVLLQQHRVGEALVQAQRCELPAGAPDVQNQVYAGDVAQDVQEDLIREAQEVGTICHRGRCRGRIAGAGCVLKTRGINFHGIPQGGPQAREAFTTVRGEEETVTKNLNCRLKSPQHSSKAPFNLHTRIALQK